MSHTVTATCATCRGYGVVKTEYGEVACNRCHGWGAFNVTLPETTPPALQPVDIFFSVIVGTVLGSFLTLLFFRIMGTL